MSDADFGAFRDADIGFDGLPSGCNANPHAAKDAGWNCIGPG